MLPARKKPLADFEVEARHLNAMLVCTQDRAMSSGDTKFRQLLVELRPPVTAASTWVQVKRAVSGLFYWWSGCSVPAPATLLDLDAVHLVTHETVLPVRQQALSTSVCGTGLRRKSRTTVSTCTRMTMYSCCLALLIRSSNCVADVHPMR
jgi:hypothetical protein